MFSAGTYEQSRPLRRVSRDHAPASRSGATPPYVRSNQPARAAPLLPNRARFSGQMREAASFTSRW
jgi:hypothetical protein